VIVIASLAVAGQQSGSMRRPVAIASSWLIGLLAAAYFVYLLFFAGLSGTERRRVYVMMVLFIAATMYYAGQEQTATSLTLFADRYTDRSFFGWQIPAGVFQSVSSVYILLLAPFFSALWVALDKRGRDLSDYRQVCRRPHTDGTGLLGDVRRRDPMCRGSQGCCPRGCCWLCYLVQDVRRSVLGPVGLSS